MNAEREQRVEVLGEGREIRGLQPEPVAALPLTRLRNYTAIFKYATHPILHGHNPTTTFRHRNVTKLSH